MASRKRRTFLRTGHGQGKGRPHVEVPRDAMPLPVPGQIPVSARPVERRSNGQLASSDAAKELGRRGGLAKARKLRLVDALGLADLAADSHFGPYRDAADAFVAHHLSELAALAGGRVGSAPSTMVSSAALQLAASRFAFDMFALSAEQAWLKLGSQLANDSRQNLLAAYSHAVLEATAREGADDDFLYEETK